MTKVGRIELELLYAGMNGFCGDRMNSGKCCERCPCGGNDRCLLSAVKELLDEHLEER